MKLPWGAERFSGVHLGEWSLPAIWVDLGERFVQIDVWIVFGHGTGILAVDGNRIVGARDGGAEQ